MTSSRSGRHIVWACAAIVGLAAFLRFYALQWGLPAVYNNPDEMPILSRALAFAKGDPNPHNFLYPSLYFYALFAWESIFFVMARLTGVYGSLVDFQNDFFLHPDRLILVGRALTATAGVLTVWAVYRFGRNLFGSAAGLGAALFLAVAPFAVRDAHYVKLDVPTALFVTLAFASLSTILMAPDAAGRPRSWIVSGYLAGLAMSSHYYAVFVAVPFPFVAAARFREIGGVQRALMLLAVAGAAATAGFVTGTPFLLLEPNTAIRDIAGVREVDIDRAVAAGRGLFPYLPEYFRMLLTDAIGWPVVAAAFLGVSVAGWRRAILLLSFFVAFLAFVSYTVPQNRYLNILLPVIAVAAAGGVTRVLRANWPLRPALVAVVFAIMAIPGLEGSIRSDRFFLQTDTRTLAATYLEAHVPSGATLLVQPYSVPLHRSRESIVEALRKNLGTEDRASVKFKLQLAASPYPTPAFRLLYLGEGGLDPDKIYLSPRDLVGDLAPLQRAGVDYVVLKRYNAVNPLLDPLESALRQRARLVATFSPYQEGVGPERQRETAPFLHNTAARIAPALRRPGPIVDIWQIN